MNGSEIPLQSIRDVLAPFGRLRAQPVSDWMGEGELFPSLVEFYEVVGPEGADGPSALEGLVIPTIGNPFEIFALLRLWERQEGYRWEGVSGERLMDWHDDWLVVADQGGDPFIFDGSTGEILHARHGEGAWKPKPMFADVFAMAFVLGTIGVLHEEAGRELYDESFDVRPEWRNRLRERLASVPGVTEADAIASCLGW